MQNSCLEMRIRMNTNKFMACMYLKNEVAYQDREGTCRIGETPVALAESYSENECDAS